MALRKQAGEHALGQSTKRVTTPNKPLKIDYIERPGLVNSMDRTAEHNAHVANASRQRDGGALGKGGARVGSNKSAKAHHQLVIAHGMTRAQHDGVLGDVGSGLGHPTSVIDGGQSVASSKAAAPLADAYGGPVSPKHGRLAPIHPAMRSAANRQAHGRTQEAHAQLASNVSRNSVRT